MFADAQKDFLHRAVNMCDLQRIQRNVRLVDGGQGESEVSEEVLQRRCEGMAGRRPEREANEHGFQFQVFDVPGVAVLAVQDFDGLLDFLFD